MQTDDPDDFAQTDRTSRVPELGRLRLIALDGPPLPQRRRAPRRQLVAAVALERRHADRRCAKPGIDGLLRTVLADEWKT
jgi:hypothetical protein